MTIIGWRPSPRSVGRTPRSGPVHEKRVCPVATRSSSQARRSRGARRPSRVRGLLPERREPRVELEDVEAIGRTELVETRLDRRCRACSILLVLHHRPRGVEDEDGLLRSHGTAVRERAAARGRRRSRSSRRPRRRRIEYPSNVGSSSAPSSRPYDRARDPQTSRPSVGLTIVLAPDEIGVEVGRRARGADHDGESIVVHLHRHLHVTGAGGAVPRDVAGRCRRNSPPA